MQPRVFRWLFLLFLAAGLPVVSFQDGLGQQEEDVKLPNGKSQKDEILKAERQQNIADAARLVNLAKSLETDLEKGDRLVLSVDTLKKTDDIEKLAKKIRGRLRH